MKAKRHVILVVEDSPEDRYSYRRMIEAGGAEAYSVLEAEDASAGLALLRSVAVDCLVLDYNLPDLDGLSFLAKIAQEPEIIKGVPVIFLTGQGNETVAVQAMKHGAADYLVKGTLSGDLLARAIRHALETREARQALEEQNTFLNALLETIPHPIFYRDTQGRYTGCNKAFEQFAGKDRSEIVGRTPMEVLVVNDSERYFESEAQLLQQAGMLSTETAVATHDGRKREVIVSKATFTDHKGKIKGLVGSVMDITERKQMEAALRQTTVQLQENLEKLGAANSRILEQQKAVIEEERLKVLLQMAGATAHELNQPLVELLGYIDLFDFDKDDPQKVGSHLSKIKAAGQRIAEIVKTIQSIRPDQNHTKVPGSVITLEQDVHLLVIDDSDADFRRLCNALHDQPRIDILRVRDPSDALEKLAERPIDLIVLDYLLPSGNGLDFLRKLEEKECRVPVIFSTGHGDEMIAAQAIQAGAYDYLPKAKVDRDNLLRTIAHVLDRHRLKTEVNQAMRKMADMSVRDELTGLYNRRYMNEVLDREYSRAKRYDSDLSCLLIDMDFFKQINDSYGHIFGDHVLRSFAGMLRDNVRESDFCFRYGGEEFMVLLPNTDIEGANNTAEKLRTMVEAKLFEDGQNSTHLTLSVGSVSLKRHRPPDMRSMLAFADKALYRAKSDGRNRLKMYLEAGEGAGQEREVPLDMVYFRERLASILDKTRNASLNSLALLLDQLGAVRFKEHHQRALVQIDVLGQKMRLPTKILDTIKRAAALHDHLKVLMPAAVTDKKEPLDSFDRAYIENHSTMLAEVTRLFEFFQNEREILLYHQERYDGEGYPSGLKGEQIPLGARLYAIADAVTAMLSERPYRPALTGRQVVEELQRNAGTQFDPNLVRIFIAALDDNPALQLPAEYIEAKQQEGVSSPKGPASIQ